MRLGYQLFGGPFCLHLQVVKQCNDVIGYQRFGGSFCFHFHVVTPCSDVVGYPITYTTWRHNQKTRNGIVFSVPYFPFTGRFGVGQNLYLVSSKGISPNGQQDWQAAVNSWYNEVKDFSRNNIAPFK